MQLHVGDLLVEAGMFKRQGIAHGTKWPLSTAFFVAADTCLEEMPV